MDGPFQQHGHDQTCPALAEQLEDARDAVIDTRARLLVRLLLVTLLDRHAPSVLAPHIGMKKSK
ncbi:hypothetical protein SAV14893_037780 [Streptomyces avermitilis]|uniref:Uncharacterized protein n=1 Tax=Streptomyces avermitilis TaxID=33903 RepID=A0A4D4LTN2_STRAX|nr:hypothetical protein SAVMC3_49780 [Streptomyces avermitilis]GDY64385.1 hypothetical protein SAV14893_037780 [Streptomyces avermitilis]GDY84437.1 hypothetical protein SAVCW2_36360 [Streptomyces avermitilis]